MYNAELYHINNSIQKRDALQCLREYVKKIQWKNNGDTIIDIGCGDGTVTSEILKIFLSYNCKKLIGCDINEKMIEFANKNNACDQTSYIVFDIEGDMRDELRGKFDHAFSSYTLHWIINQKAAFTNIYELLEKGGDCCLLFLGNIPIYDVFRLQARNPKWSPWMKDVERYVSPYHDCQDPEEEIKRMMINIGFIDIEVKCTLKSYTFPNMESAKSAVGAVMPFPIPEELKDDFLNDYANTFKQLSQVNQVEDVNNRILDLTVKYNLITVYGKK